VVDGSTWVTLLLQVPRGGRRIRGPEGAGAGTRR